MWPASRDWTPERDFAYRRAPYSRFAHFGIRITVKMRTECMHLPHVLYLALSIWVLIKVGSVSRGSFGPIWVPYALPFQTQLVQNRPDGSSCRGNIHCVSKCCFVRRGDLEGTCVTPPAGMHAVSLKTPRLISLAFKAPHCRSVENKWANPRLIYTSCSSTIFGYSRVTKGVPVLVPLVAPALAPAAPTTTP